MENLGFVRGKILDESQSLICWIAPSRDVVVSIEAVLVQVILIVGQIHLLWFSRAEEENRGHENHRCEHYVLA